MASPHTVHNAESHNTIFDDHNGITRSSSQFLVVTLSFFAVGFSTFALLYAMQPILPIIGQEFNISPANASLSLSISTTLMAVGLLITGPISDAIGRKNVMIISLILAALFTMLSGFMVHWGALLICRALIGLALSGVVAVAMTYLSEEIHPSVVALSIGLYISGNSIGGMTGRFITAALSDYFSWRGAMVILGTLSLCGALVIWKILPVSKHFKPGSLKPKRLVMNIRFHLHDKGLPILFAQAFLLMGSFVTLFNYISYRLLESPYNFSQTLVGFLSISYLTGTYTSSKAGQLTQRYGRANVLFSAILIALIGILITLASNIWLILLGMMIFTAGFFAAHSVCSSWIGLRAKRAKAQASSLYLFSFYMGSSAAGTLGGIFWLHFAWHGVALFIAALLSISLLMSLRLRPLSPPIK